MVKKTTLAADLDIDLSSKNETELFKWFLACLLFGNPIHQAVAIKTYHEFIENGILSPEIIINTGPDKLVQILDEGHYVRYDFSTAAKLIRISKELISKYGNVTKMIEESGNYENLLHNMTQFYGVGPKTAEIFLRDISPIYFNQF